MAKSGGRVKVRSEIFLAHDQDQTSFHRKETALLETSLKKFRMGKMTVTEKNIVVSVAGQLGFDYHFMSERSHTTKFKVEKLKTLLRVQNTVVVRK